MKDFTSNNSYSFHIGVDLKSIIHYSIYDWGVLNIVVFKIKLYISKLEFKILRLSSKLH